LDGVEVQGHRASEHRGRTQVPRVPTSQSGGARGCARRRVRMCVDVANAFARDSIQRWRLQPRGIVVGVLTHAGPAKIIGHTPQHVRTHKSQLANRLEIGRCPDAELTDVPTARVIARRTREIAHRTRWVAITRTRNLQAQRMAHARARIAGAWRGSACGWRARVGPSGAQLLLSRFHKAVVARESAACAMRGAAGAVRVGAVRNGGRRTRTVVLGTSWRRAPGCALNARWVRSRLRVALVASQRARRPNGGADAIGVDAARRIRRAGRAERRSARGWRARVGPSGAQLLLSRFHKAVVADKRAARPVRGAARAIGVRAVCNGRRRRRAVILTTRRQR